jgi:hypothetical protein
MISPNDTLFLLPPFHLFLIQGIAEETGALWQIAATLWFNWVDQIKAK